MKKLLKWLGFCLSVMLLTLTVYADSPALPALAVTVEDYVYGSERSTPSVSGNLEGGTESYFIRPYSESGGGNWREITERPVSRGMPTEGGRYELKVTVGATASYGGGSAICDFNVLPTDLDIGLAVKDSIAFGDSCTEGGLFSVSDLLGRQYSVAYAKKGSDVFTTSPPTEIGVYTLKVSVDASKNFNATEKTADFEITKRSVGGELKLDDITVIYGSGAVIAPIPTYVGDSELVRRELLRLSPIAEYRPAGSNESFSATVPSEVGEYEVRVSYGESRNIYSSSVTATLRITRSPISPSVSIGGWVYGETPNEPQLSDGSNPGNGRVYYYYRPEGGEYSAAFPTDAGNYTLKVIIESAEGYAGGECFAEFTIEKAERTEARLVFGDARYGDTLPAPYVSGTLDGAEVVFSYSPRGKNDYSPTPPTESGEYTLRAEIAEGKNYRAKTVTFDFVIEKAEIYAAVFVENRIFGDSGWTVAVSGNDGGGKYTLSYYVKTASGYAPLSDADMFDGRPFRAGEYKVICEIFETKNHKGSITEAKFTIDRAIPALTVSMDSYTYFAKAPEPTVSGNAEGGGVSFVYYPKGGDISGGSYDISEIVTAPGEYTVAAVVSQTENYKTATVTADFTVFKADLPVSSMSLSIKCGGVEVGEIGYGSEYELSLKNNVGYGAVSFTYQSEGGEFTTEKPRAVGKYKAKATVAATDIYKSLTVTFEFSIVKAERTDVTLEQTESVYGTPLSDFVLVGNTEELTDENKSYSFKPSGADDSAYSPSIPTETGKYTVKLVISETDSYLGAVIFGELTIKKAPSIITANSASGVYSGEPILPQVSLNHSEAELHFESELPTEAGEYEITVSVPESKNYESASLTFTFTVFAAQGEITGLEMPDAVWNGDPISAPVFNTVGDGEVKVEYYKDGQLLDGTPTEVGEYTVRVTLSDGKNYAGCFVEKTFKITPLTVIPESETIPHETGDPSKSQGENSGLLWLIVLMILAVMIAIAVTVMIIIRRSNGGGGSDGFEPNGELPPSDNEGAEALDQPPERDALTDGRSEGGASSGEPEPEKKKKPRGEYKAERLTDRGRIALDMWLTGEGIAPEEGVVYKKRGKYAEINLDTLCRHFDEGERVDLETLKAKGLIPHGCKRVKLLGRGELTKNLDIKLDDYSKSVKESMEAFK